MIIKATATEYENAKAVCKSVYAQVNGCQREGFVYNGWFIYTEPCKRYFYKTKTVDKFLKQGVVD